MRTNANKHSRWKETDVGKAQPQLYVADRPQNDRAPEQHREVTTARIHEMSSAAAPEAHQTL